MVDVINENIYKKILLCKDITVQKGSYLPDSKKKRGRLIGEEKHALHRKIFDVSRSVFNWLSEKNKFINEHYFFYFKVLKERSNYHFHYFLISNDKHVKKYF